MSRHDRTIQRFRARLAILLILKHTLPLLTAWGFLWGTAVLALRALRGTPASLLLWGLAGIPVAGALGMVLGLRRLPTRAAVRALLDGCGGYGGLLMAQGEVEVGAWEGAMPERQAPQAHWQGGRAWGLLAIAAGFVALSFLVPQWLADLDPAPRLEIDQEILRLAAKLDLLRTEAVLDPSRADALKKKLEQLGRESSGKDPARTLEALDHLASLLNREARKSAESAARKSERLGRAETVAEALRKVGSSLEPKPQREALALLSSLLRKEGGLESLAKHLDAGAARRDKPGGSPAPTLDIKQLAQVAEALRANKGDLARRVEKLHKAGLIDRETLRRLERSSAARADALAKALTRDAGKTPVAEMVGAAHKGEPGEVHRPRSQVEGLKFKEIVLPPAALAERKGARQRAGSVSDGGRNTSVTHVSGSSSGQRAGSVSDGGQKNPVTHVSGSSSGALAKATPGGGSANTQPILPRHRAAVERYFARTGAR